MEQDCGPYCGEDACTMKPSASVAGCREYRSEAWRCRSVDAAPLGIGDLGLDAARGVPIKQVAVVAHGAAGHVEPLAGITPERDRIVALLAGWKEVAGNCLQHGCI